MRSPDRHAIEYIISVLFLAIVRSAITMSFFATNINPLYNGGVSSLQVAAHRKPVLTLVRMRDILTRMVWRRPTPS
jgi:hypothetical protein